MDYSQTLQPFLNPLYQPPVAPADDPQDRKHTSIAAVGHDRVTHGSAYQRDRQIVTAPVLLPEQTLKPYETLILPYRRAENRVSIFA